MALAVPGQWTSSGTRTDVQVPAQPAEGSWLIATIAYCTVDGTEPLASVSDMGRNWWLLCGSAFNATSNTRVEVWACPSVMFAGFPLAIVYSAVSHIAASDTGSHVVHVCEVTGFVNGFPTVVSVTTGTATGTSLTLNIPDPTPQVFILGAAAVDDVDAVITVPSPWWGALTGVSRATPDLKLSPVWVSTAGLLTTTWTSDISVTWTGVAVALAETGTVWDQPNSNWPATRLELGAGFGQDVPLPRVTWVDHTDRFEELTASRGVPYELGRPQAGEAALTLSNFDDVLTSEAGGDYDLYTPYRLLMAWDGKVYPVSAGWAEESARSWRTPHHGYVEMSGVDALATLVQDVPTALRGEILRREPFAYWPLSDPSGALVAANISTRSSFGLQMTQSKYGVANASADFGATIGIEGDPGGGWQQQGLVAADTKRGFALVGRSDEFPAISGGITIIGMALFATDLNTQPDNGITLCILRSGDARNGTTIKVWMDTTLGVPQVTVWDKDTAVATTTAGAFNIAQPFFIPWVLRFSRTSWRLVTQSVGSEISGSCDLPNVFTVIDIGGEADEIYAGNAGNVTHAHIAMFDRQLTDDEVTLIIDPAATGWQFGGEPVRDRAQRYMATAGSLLPRAFDHGNTYGSRDDQTGVLLQRLSDLADQEAGLLFGDAGGDLRFRTSSRTYQQAPRWTLGDNTGAGEIPFQVSATITTGPTYLYNRVNVTTSAEYTISAASKKSWSERTHTADDATSGARYGIRPLDRAVNLYYPGHAQLLAEWLLAQYKDPAPRFAEITVDAARYPAAWPLVLGVECGDLVDVVRRPIGQDPVALSCRVMQVKPRISGGRNSTAGEVTLTLAAAPPPVLIVGDPVKGKLGDNTIGWD